MFENKLSYFFKVCMAVEEKVENRISLIMRSARKFKGITQQELAVALECSQSALSKMENGVLIPSAPQWFSFCAITDIPVESFVRGYIDRQQNAEILNGKISNGHNIPSRYLNDRGIKIKMIKPFLSFLAENYGEDSLGSFLKKKKLSQDYFVDLDNQISLNFIYDFYKYMKETETLSADNLKRIAQNFNKSDVHGLLYETLVKTRTPIETLNSFVNNYRHYQADFLISVKDKTVDSITINVKPKLHLRRFKITNDEEFGSFLNNFLLYSFEEIAILNRASEKVKGEIITELFNGSDSAVLKFTMI